MSCPRSSSSWWSVTVARARLGVAAAALLAATLAGAGPASAQDEQPTTSTTAPPSTTSSSTSTTTTSAPPARTSSTAPPSTSPPGTVTSTTTSTTSTTIDPDDPAGFEEAQSEDVPVTDVTVPGSAGAVPLVRRDIGVARAEAVASTTAVAEAIDRVDELAAELADRQYELARLDAAHERTLVALAETETEFRRRVADALVRGGSNDLAYALSANDVTELEVQSVYSRGLADGDLAAIQRYHAARDALDDGLLVAYDDVARLRRELRTARSGLDRTLADNAAKRYRLAIVGAGSPIVVDGFVFPVEGPYQFIDSWGFPRMTGTEYSHGHQGVDIMADFGRELYAVEDGVVVRLGTDVLGGVKLWLKGASGTYYYYAHLQRYADGVAEGDTVRAGSVVGYVGDSGNARGGAPHLHFQVHPGGGSAVNPYGLLRAVADLDATAT